MGRQQARARFLLQCGAALPQTGRVNTARLHQGASMLRSGLRRAAAASAPLRTLRRNLNLHEYQSAALMAEKGVNVPFGLPASTVEEAVAAAATIGDEEVVIKSQILAGGRGLGSFTNGLKGGVHVIKTSEVAEYAGKMLGGTLVTKQVRVSVRFGLGWRWVRVRVRLRVGVRITLVLGLGLGLANPNADPDQSGPEGKPVNTIMLAKKMNLTKEMYLAIMLDRASMGNHKPAPTLTRTPTLTLTQTLTMGSHKPCAYA